MSSPGPSSPTTDEHAYTIRPAKYSDLPDLPAIESSAGTLFLSDPSLAILASDSVTSTDQHHELLDRWTNAGLGEGGTWVATVCKKSNSPKTGDDDDDHDDDVTVVVGFIATSLIPLTRETRTGNEATTSGVGRPPCPNGAGCSYFVHVHELSVHAAHQRRGLAARLLHAVRDCAVRWSSLPSDSLSSERAPPHWSAAVRSRVVGLSLITMRDVPYNAPFYAKVGFERVEERDIEDVVGTEGVRMWRDDQEHFTALGDGELRTRRCFMVCLIWV